MDGVLDEGEANSWLSLTHTPSVCSFIPVQDSGFGLFAFTLEKKLFAVGGRKTYLLSCKQRDGRTSQRARLPARVCFRSKPLVLSGLAKTACQLGTHFLGCDAINTEITSIRDGEARLELIKAALGISLDYR